ncbi:MAG TPA: hypothetical protein VGK99_01605 [Acidobacteriota bacterium]
MLRDQVLFEGFNLMLMHRRRFLRLAGPLVFADTAWSGFSWGARGGRRRTVVSIRNDRFFINGRPTYQGRRHEGVKIEGLLMNSRMVQGIFDDLNPETRARWRYPDTGAWDPERNTREFCAAMAGWRQAGLLSFTINLQGGSPEGYSNEQPWHNSAFLADGSLRSDYMRRLERIFNRADELGMAPILGYFYFGQDQRLRNETAVKRGATEATLWLFQKSYRNILVEVCNECDNRKYDHDILKPSRVAELINLVKSMRSRGRRLLVGVSFNGGSIPHRSVIAASDFLLLHGNGVSNPRRIARMVELTRRDPSYRPMPILFNEDDHFDFDKSSNNMMEALRSYASWGFFDPGKNNYWDGYQSPPVNWGINAERKKAFFALLRRVTGGAKT